MSILFLNLPNPPGIQVNRDYCGGFGSAFRIKEGTKRNVFPPIFDAYAAAVLENKGFEVSIVDAQATNLSELQLLQKIKAKNPKIVISRISLPAFDNDLRIMAKIKEILPEAVLIGWGSICKVEPEAPLAKGELDIVIRDELEFAAPEVAEKLWNEGDLSSVKGISFKAQERIIHNQSRPLQKDLDVLPFPAYHLLPMDKYVARESYFFTDGSEDKFVPFFTMLASRGCSLNCLYCPYPTVFGPWRGMSAKRVVDEIEKLVTEYGVRLVWFHDQTFSMMPKQTEKLCGEIINRGLDVTWACETRVDKLSIPLVKKMKSAGCSRIQVGIETGDPELLKKLGKRGCTIETIEKTLKFVQKEGILLEANFMVGLPGDSWKAVKNTANLIKKIKPDDVAVSIATPYPGTPLFKIAKQRNWLITNDWKNYSTMTPVMKLPNFSDKDIKDAQRYLYHLAQSRINIRNIAKSAKRRKLVSVLKEATLALPEFCVYLYSAAKVKIRSILI